MVACSANQVQSAVVEEYEKERESIPLQKDSANQCGEQSHSNEISEN